MYGPIYSSMNEIANLTVQFKVYTTRTLPKSNKGISCWEETQIELIQDQASAVQSEASTMYSTHIPPKWDSMKLFVPLCVLDGFREPAHGALAKNIN
jgi:hypothetical protein